MSNIKPLIVHAHATGPNPQKVTIALELLNVPYSVKMWDFGDDAKKGVKGAAYTAINENGRVPAVEDPNTGVTSWESGACINYLKRVYDKSGTLGPKSSAGTGGKSGAVGEQDIVDLEKWEYFLLSTLGPMQGQTNWFRHYHPQKNEDALARYEAQTYRCYGVLEGQLAKSGGQSILPGGLSSADVHFHPWVKGYGFTGLSLEKYPHVDKWLKTLDAMTEFKEGYKKIAEAPEGLRYLLLVKG